MSNGINAPYGLETVYSQIGNGGTQKLGKYNIYASADGLTTYNGNIFKGDMVKYSPPGKDFTTTGLGTIVAGLTPSTGTAAGVILGLPVGIFMGCQFYDAQTGVITPSDYWPAGRQVKPGTSILAFVNDDPEVVFKVQISTATNNTDAAAQNNVAPSIFQNIFRGQNASLQVGGVAFNAPVGAIPTNNPATGNTVTGRSAYYLDGSSITLAAGDNPGNAAFEIKIIGLVPETQSAPNPANLVQGVNMPFIDVLCKFNVHIHGSVGTPGVFFTNA